jgi:hypothetical protein
MTVFSLFLHAAPEQNHRVYKLLNICDSSHDFRACQEKSRNCLKFNEKSPLDGVTIHKKIPLASTSRDFFA